MRARIQVALTAEQQETISKFWDTEGEYAGAMLGQPSFNGSAYELILSMYSEEEMDLLVKMLNEIRRGKPQTSLE